MWISTTRKKLGDRAVPGAQASSQEVTIWNDTFIHVFFSSIGKSHKDHVFLEGSLSEPSTSQLGISV